jgi:hypothetical protein
MPVVGETLPPIYNITTESQYPLGEWKEFLEKLGKKDGENVIILNCLYRITILRLVFNTGLCPVIIVDYHVGGQRWREAHRSC